MIGHTRSHVFASVSQTAGASTTMQAKHPSDDTLERYAMGAVRDKSELARLEEHLLACPDCVARAEAWEDYVWSVRSALRRSLH